jgi:anti-anti-sigma factor
MDIEQQTKGAVQVLVPAGRLDTDSSADFELAIQDLQAVDVKHFVIDLSKVGYISSAGLRVLLSLAKQVDGGRGSLRLCGLNAQTKQVFDIAGFTKMFAIYPDQATALDKHPHLGDAAPDLGKLAAKLMGAKKAAAASEASGGMAAAAAGLLGAKPAPAAKPAAAASAPSAKPDPSAATPPAAPSGAAPAAAPAAKKPGFFARLFGKK